MTSRRRALLLPIAWIGIVSVILAGDYLTGPFVQFPIFFLIPVALATWYSGRWWGYGLALGMPLVRLYFALVWPDTWSTVEDSVNTAIQISVLSTFTFLIYRTAVQTQALAQRVRTLEGILPICSFCKKIRDQENRWHTLEHYISSHSAAQFSHGVCPECGRRHYGDLFNSTDNG